MRIEGQVQRPPLPSLFFLALSFWPTTAVLLMWYEHQLQSVMTIFACIGFAGAICITFVLYRKGLKPFVLGCLGFCLAFPCAGISALSLQQDMAYIHNAGLEHYSFQVVGDAAESDYGMHCMARAYDLQGRSHLVRVNLPDNTSVACWDIFSLECDVRKPSRTAESFYWRKGSVGSVSPQHIEAQRAPGVLGFIAGIREKGIALFEDAEQDITNCAGSAFMRSIVFGDRSDFLSSPLYGTVKRLGLAHIVAVSGAHLSITIAMLALLLRFLKCPRGMAVAIQVVACFAYVLLTGAPHSALRACVMATCALSSFYAGRRGFALNALCACITIFIVIDPFLALSTSLLLSSLATLGIVLFAEYLSSWVLELFNQSLPGICSIIGMSLAAIVATMPVTASLFGQLSLIAPLSNVLATPVFSFLCVSGMIVGLLASLVPGMSYFAGLLIEVSQGFCLLLELLARVPYAATSVALPLWMMLSLVVGFAACLYLFWPRPTRAKALLTGLTVSAAFIVSIGFGPLLHGNEIIMLDVGQGDAFVLRSGGQSILIDTGNQDSAVLQGLARHDVRHLDAVVISHPDDDHCGSLTSILDFVEVDRVLVANDLLSCACDNCSRLRHSAGKSNLCPLRAGDSITWGCFRALVLHPSCFRDKGGNDDSLVLQVYVDVDQDQVDDARALFCGDTEEDVLMQLGKAGVLEQVDVFKVGHHGSDESCNQELLDILCPRIALVSAGVDNRYGHPHPNTIELLDAGEMAVFRTDQQGDVVCKIGASQIDVFTLR